MTKVLQVLVVLVAVTARAQVSNSPVRITGIRENVLSWTNCTGVPTPVYRLMQSGSVTGPWQAALWITNESSVTLTNLPTAPEVAFYKTEWAFASDSPMNFTYSFEEGYGFPAVVGTVTLNSSAALGGTNIGSWSFEEGLLCIDCLHPLGNANFAGGYIDWSGATHTVMLNFTAGSERVYLTGTMQTTTVNGRAVYSGMSGDVYLSGFSGPDLIGTFTAIRDP